jgi:hypothetical protein
MVPSRHFSRVPAAIVPAFAEFFPVHAAITQPLAIEMRCGWRARFAKLDAIVFFSKCVPSFRTRAGDRGNPPCSIATEVFERQPDGSL